MVVILRTVKVRGYIINLKLVIRFLTVRLQPSSKILNKLRERD